MTTTHGSREEILTINDQADLDYWHDQMKGDVQFIQYMTEIYKKQRLELHTRDQENRRMTHHPCSPSFSSPNQQPKITRHIPQLMDNPIYSPTIQHQQHPLHNRPVTTSTDHPVASSYNQTSSTPRRPLEESGSEYKFQRQAKKSRPHEPTPTTRPPITTSSSSSTNQFLFPPVHLKRAISSNLPCFHIKFENKTGQIQMPSAMKVASGLREIVLQQASSFGDFSLFVPAGNDRYKFGVASKSEFLMLWNCKWPGEIEKLKVEIQRPRALPDCCAVVLRHVSNDLSSAFVYQEITKSVISAVSFSKINNPRPRSTTDFRFCVTDTKEYDEIISIGRISIGHLLLPITSFIPGLKMTYCNNCWQLGHIRPQCKAGPVCRKCLDPWNLNHVCQKPVLCAQCNGPHSSLSMECPVVTNYRRTLKHEVNNAVKNGLLNPVDFKKESPVSKQVVGTHAAWIGKQGPQNNTTTQHENKQVENLITQINAVLDIIRRTESKIDNQALRVELLEKKGAVNKQGIIVLANIMQQTIKAMLEKKNIQQLQLQNISKQIEDFKDDIVEKFNILTIDQQQTSTSASLLPTNSQQIESTTSLRKENNNQMEQDQSMNIIDGQ